MYIQDEEASVRVPIWQLAAFKRVQVESGGESRVRICIRARDLAVIRQDGTCVLEPVCLNFMLEAASRTR